MERLSRIENPGNLKVKLANLYVKKQYGKVITPMKILYARKPELMDVLPKLTGKDKKLKLDKELKHLLRYFVAVLNGCGFCKDIGKAIAFKEGEGNRKFEAVLNYSASNLFSEKEKIAFEWAENLVQKKNVPDEVFEKARKLLTEQEMIEVTYLVASETYINMMNHTFGIGSDHLCQNLID